MGGGIFLRRRSAWHGLVSCLNRTAFLQYAMPDELISHRVNYVADLQSSVGRVTAYLPRPAAQTLMPN